MILGENWQEPEHPLILPQINGIPTVKQSLASEHNVITQRKSMASHVS
jgi:hypothetical protein